MQSFLPARQILVVDDDAGLREQIAGYLREHGYVLHLAGDARAMEAVLAARSIDLIILDLMLPGEDGLSICRRVAGAGGPAIVMMSAMGDEVDRVLGLELGADDYLSKPCSPRELLARVRAVIRRLDEARSGAPGRAKVYEFLGFMVDAHRRHVRTPSGTTVLLTAGEFALLQAFLDNPQRILSRDQLLEHAHGGEPDPAGRAVDVQISRLRRKLHAEADGEIIRTMRGAGYMLDAKVSRA
ncbi:response regulator [Phenylobacterium sp. LjRoot225]|uniref:response regulator n=1 Tax=Phenylobacterium sp. LjRoot225 TaxID=3342285 RepID=UPI003ED043D2